MIFDDSKFPKWSPDQQKNRCFRIFHTKSNKSHCFVKKHHFDPTWAYKIYLKWKIFDCRFGQSYYHVRISSRMLIHGQTRSLILDPWSSGSWRTGLWIQPPAFILHPWSLILILDPWSLILDPWSVILDPWYMSLYVAICSYMWLYAAICRCMSLYVGMCPCIGTD